MKILIVFILTMLVNCAFAGSDYPPIVSASNPGSNGEASQIFEGQSFSLWGWLPYSSCVGGFAHYVIVTGSVVDVFITPSSILCFDPPPPVYRQIASFNPMSVGTYTLNVYDVPSEDGFPPAVVDYPSYFSGTLQFSVQAAPVALVIDSSSKTSLFLIMLILFGLTYKKVRG